MSHRDLPREPGVYLLTHDTTRDTYVGSAKDIWRRCGIHVSGLRGRCHANADLIEKLKPTLNRIAPPGSEHPLKFGPSLKLCHALVTPDTHKALLHLAIDLDETVEKLAGKLIAQAVERTRAELNAAKPKPHR